VDGTVDASDLWQNGKIVGSGLTGAVSATTPSRAVTLLVLTPTKITLGARVKPMITLST